VVLRVVDHRVLLALDLESVFYFKNYFCQKGQKMAFLNRNKAKLCENLIITLVFEKNADFFAEN
jgi:hypothetical protein